MSTTPPLAAFDTFRIGVFAQHTRDLEKWRKRGVDLFAGHQRGDPKLAFETRAQELGAAFVSLPGDNLELEAAQPGRLAFALHDEPDLNDRPNPAGPGAQPATVVRSTPAQVQAEADRIRKATGGRVPIFCNFAGGKFDNDWYKGDGPDGHQAYFAAPDVLGADYYFPASGRPPGPRGADPLKPSGFSFIHEKIMDRLHACGRGKPFYLFVESGPQNLEGKGRPGPSIGQFHYIAAHACHYARLNGYRLAGLIVFSIQERPWIPDTTDPALAAAMPAIFNECRAIMDPPTIGNRPADPLDAVGAELEALRGQMGKMASTVQTLAGATASMAEQVRLHRTTSYTLHPIPQAPAALPHAPATAQAMVDGKPLAELEHAATAALLKRLPPGK